MTVTVTDHPPPTPRSLLRDPGHFVALGFGSGCMPVAPGTWGTVVGVAAFAALSRLTWPWYLAVVMICAVAGIAICGRTARALGSHDHPAIVWDEVVGYLVTMAIAPRRLAWVLVGFVVFRVLDIWKPWPISVLDRRCRGGLGIMADDIAAGLAALAILEIISYIYYAFIL